MVYKGGMQAWLQLENKRLTLMRDRNYPYKSHLDFKNMYNLGKIHKRTEAFTVSIPIMSAIHESILYSQASLS